MKIKLMLLLLFALLAKSSFADEGYDTIIKQNMVYVEQPDDKVIADALIKALNKCWTATPYKIIALHDPILKDKKGKIAVLYTGSAMNQNLGIQLIHCKDEYANKFYADVLRSISIFYPNKPVADGNAPFFVAMAVKWLNDNVEYYKKNKKPMTDADVNTHAAEIKNKILLIPQEITFKKRATDFSNLTFNLDSTGLSGYRFSYKILPFKKINTILADSEEAQGYCFFYYCDAEELHIFDAVTNTCLLLNRTGNRCAEDKIKKKDMEHISDIIDGIKQK